MIFQIPTNISDKNLSDIGAIATYSNESEKWKIHQIENSN